MGDWIPVFNKHRNQRGDSFQNLFTLFVDNLPEDVSQNWLRKTYSKFGVVKDVFIPLKRSKATGRNFGFIRYDNENSVEKAIEETNGIWIEDRKLFVKWASFDQRREKIQHTAFNKSTNIVHGEATTTMHNVWSRSNGNEIRKTKGAVETTKQGEERIQKTMEYKMVEGRSYALAVKGGESHDILSNIESIQIQPKGNGWLYRSAIAKIRRLLSTEELEKEFRLEKVIDVQIRALGGRFVIITFPNEESRDAIIKEKWVTNWFEEIKPWNGDSAKDERFVWISCFGMPLNAWSMQTFKDIGSKWGHFVKVDDDTLRDKSFEKGRILIATEHSQKIEGKLQLVVSGKRYMIRVEEEESFRKVVSENSFIDLDSETWEKDEVMAQNNDPKNGFVDVEKSKEEVEASKAKNSEESSVHGEGNKRVEDDQLSQIPKEGHILEVVSDEMCNEESSVHGLISLVEDSAGPSFATNKDQNKEIKDQCDNDQRLEISVPNEQVHNGDRSITLMNEPLVIDSRNNLGAFQMEGINLVVDLKPSDLRKRIRSQSFVDCMSSGESEFVQNSCSSRGTRQDQEDIDAELQLTTNVGKRLGVKMTERDVQRMRKMIEMEVKERVIVQRSTSAC